MRWNKGEDQNFKSYFTVYNKLYLLKPVFVLLSNTVFIFKLLGHDILFILSSVNKVSLVNHINITTFSVPFKIPFYTFRILMVYKTHILSVYFNIGYAFYSLLNMYSSKMFYLQGHMLLIYYSSQIDKIVQLCQY